MARREERGRVWWIAVDFTRGGGGGGGGGDYVVGILQETMICMMREQVNAMVS
jgi:hypothetical protein